MEENGLLIAPRAAFEYEGKVPPDKSVTHRAVMLNAAASGKAEIKNPLLSLDTLATAECMRKLGAKIEFADNGILVEGADTFRDGELLQAENSGTTMRLLAGLLAGREVNATIDGDQSLRRRPMDRVIRPLSKLGAQITSENGRAPLTVLPKKLAGTEIEMEVASAQVKSAILLAGIHAEGETIVRFSVPTRDHTERMLKSMGAEIEIGKNAIRVAKSCLTARDVEVCGDISSAAFLLGLGALLGSVKLFGVGINPTRSGILTVLERFGVRVEVSNLREVCGEPVADLSVTKAGIKGIEVSGDLTANVIDEIPLIAVLACFGKGKTVIRDAGELRVKESDRIRLLAENLSGLGASVKECPDGLEIEGTGGLTGNPKFVADPRGDHRIAMCMAVAAMASKRGGRVSDFGCVNVSFPNFAEIAGLVKV